MHLWITDDSKKTTICINGSVYSVIGLECSKHHKSSRTTCDPQECKDNKNIFCQCGNGCNLNKCYNNQKIYDDGCECDPKVLTIWNFSTALLHFCICQSLKMCFSWFKLLLFSIQDFNKSFNQFLGSSRAKCCIKILIKTEHSYSFSVTKK